MGIIINYIRGLLISIMEYFKKSLFDRECTSAARLNNKTVVITGCNRGIGKTAVVNFYIRGARVIMACRSRSKVVAAIKDIITEVEYDSISFDGRCCACRGEPRLGKLVFTELDLTSLVRKCAQNLLRNEKTIDILVNNGGVMHTPQSNTKDGYEMQFGVNHLGHFLFTLLLLPKLAKSKPSRIVTIGSLAHAFGGADFDDLNFKVRPYSPSFAYNQSKLCNILFSSELARKLQAAGIDGINTYSLHPGVVTTELGRHPDSTYMFGTNWLWNLTRRLLKSQVKSAETIIYCAVDEQCAHETGLYYGDCTTISASAEGTNEQYAKKLWEESLKYVGMEGVDPFADIAKVG